MNYWDDPVVTDEEVHGAIQLAHELGLKVCLKPVVNCKNGTWRAHINFFDVDVPGEPSWTKWFESYDNFILHYAEIAENTGCEMFSVGCEMVQVDRRETDWRNLIASVRQTYEGLITYNCDKYQEENVRWWDAVDVVSSSGYYPASTFADRVAELREFAKRVNKPVFFMGAGCMSVCGASERPNDWSLRGEIDLKEQANYYRTMFAVLEDEPWFFGFMLWDWPAELYSPEYALNRDYCFYQKPAEQVIRNYYQRIGNYGLVVR